MEERSFTMINGTVPLIIDGRYTFFSLFVNSLRIIWNFKKYCLNLQSINMPNPRNKPLTVA